MIIVIDPATREAEVGCYNALVERDSRVQGHFQPALRPTGWPNISEVSGIILLGSRASTNSAASWRPQLERYLSRAVAHETPILAACYGHQLIAQMHGAKVDRTAKFFKVPRSIKIVPRNRLGLTTETLFVINAHNEFVTQQPKGFKVLGSSLDFPVEAMEHEHLPIWTFQGHIEATIDFCLSNNLSPVSEAISSGNIAISAFLAKIGDGKKLPQG